MPFYEYQCGECDHRLEVLQKISDEPLVYCPECGQASLKKLISAAAFRLKGSGWYETDFKNNDKNKEVSKKDKTPESSDKPAAAGAASSELSGKSENAAAAKSNKDSGASASA